jgi:hypothetical protein
MEEKRNTYRVFVGRFEGKGPLERPERSWEDNIEIYLREIGREGVNWILFGSAQGSVMGCCKRGNETSGVIEYA